MEYEFRRDLMGRVEARFSMDHEAVGNWLMAELIPAPYKLAKLYDNITALKAGELWDVFLPGEEFNLKLTRSEAVVRSTALPEEDDEELEDEMSYYDQESMAQCGLDDFKDMLDAWQAFQGK